MNADFNVNGTIIETNRLILRPFKESDLNDFFEYASVAGVGEMAGWAHHQNINESRIILDMFIEEHKTFAIELKENKKVIGSLGIELVRESELLSSPLKGREIGYVLSKAYWGHGYMPEAVKGAIEYCFNTLNYDFLCCGHFKWNLQSKRVIEKSGFTFFKEIMYATRMGRNELTDLYILLNARKIVTE